MSRSILKVVFVAAALSLSFSAFANVYEVKPIKSAVVAKTPAEDALIKKSIENSIKKSKTLGKLTIVVKTNNGVVGLEGVADSKAQVTSLIELAESIIGVSDVDASKVAVKDSADPLADAIITGKIKGLFLREDLFGKKDIASLELNVETRNGVVYLTGIIDNKDQINNAIEIIKANVPEVKQVEFNVKKLTPVQQ